MWATHHTTGAVQDHHTGDKKFYAFFLHLLYDFHNVYVLQPGERADSVEARMAVGPSICHELMRRFSRAVIAPW